MSFKKPFHAVPVELGAHYRAKRKRDLRKRQVREGAFVGLVITSAAAVFAVVWSMPMTADLQTTSRIEAASLIGDRAGEPIRGCRVTDGDTIRCGNERIRLLGIDAPELPGHCREGRNCAPGDPIASTESLRDALTGELRIQRISTDRYGRTIALVSGAKGDVSCWQLRHRRAIYRDDWDDGGHLARTCPSLAR